MPVAIDPQEGFLQEVFAPLGIAEEAVEVVHQPLAVAINEDVERLNSASLKLLHQIFVTHLLERVVAAGGRTLLLLGFTDNARYICHVAPVLSCAWK